jgi:hypothetical protein
MKDFPAHVWSPEGKHKDSGIFRKKQVEIWHLINAIITGFVPFYPTICWFTTGWWYTYPSEKYEVVSWDDQIPNWMESHSKFHGSKPPTRIGL